MPYWLDGFIPLAWLLDDKDMQARAIRYIDAILERQQADELDLPLHQGRAGRLRDVGADAHRQGPGAVRRLHRGPPDRGGP